MSQNLEERTRQIIQELPESIGNHIAIVEVPAYKALYINPAGRKLLGLDAEEDVIGMVWSQFIAEEKRSVVNAGLLEAIREGNWRGGATLKKRSGVEFPAKLLVTAPKICFGEALVILGRDMTADNQQKQERSMMEKQLRYAKKMETIGRLTAGLAHDVTAATGFVAGNMSFLQGAFKDLSDAVRFYQENATVSDHPSSRPPKILMDPDELAFLVEEVPKTFQQSISGIKRTNTVLSSLEEFSVANDKNKQPSDLNHSIEVALAISKKVWGNVARLDEDYDPDMPQVPCVRDDINQVLLNILTNASYAISEAKAQWDEQEGIISIRTDYDADEIRIDIADTGIGIDDEYLEKIFDPFYTTREEEGAGQGLAIAKKVVEENHGGRLEVYSEVGEGTTFRIALPLN